MRDNQPKAGLFRCILEVMAIFWFYFLALIPLIVGIILLHDRGPWWIIFAVGYCLIFIVAAAIRHKRKILLEERATVGDEVFFMMHPNELKKEKRKNSR